VVLELNEVLCHTVPMSEAPAQFLRFPDSEFPPVISFTVPTLVSGTVVYCRPGLSVFLRFLSLFAHIHVWSTADRKVVAGLCSFLFSKSKTSPQVVLASNQCDFVLVKDYKKAMHPGTKDPILLKYPRRRLYPRKDANFNECNLLIVDSNPKSCLVVPTENTIFPDPWIHSQRDAPKPEDTYLCKTIGELILAVHLNGPENFHEIMRCRRPSQNDLSKDSDFYKYLSRQLQSSLNQDLINGIKLP
jgi:hypothetical protein